MTKFLVIVLSGDIDIIAVHGCPDMKSVRDSIEYLEFKYDDYNVSIHVYRILEV